MRLGSDLNPTCVFHDGQGEFCWAREGRERHGCDFSSCPWFRALLCRVGVCGKRVRLAGERLLVSLLANSSARSSAGHEGSRAKTCLWRLLPWDQPHPGVLWSCHSATWAEQWVRDPLERAGTPLWDGRGLGCASALGSAPSPGLSFGWLGSSGGEPLTAEPRAPRQHQEPKWCICVLAREHEGAVAV